MRDNHGGKADAVFLESILQENSGKILGYLIRICGNFQDAEDIRQDVFLSAITNWRTQGIPDTPLAWLYTTAKNRAIDHFRQQNLHHEKHTLLAQEEPVAAESLDKALEDDLLRLVFTCCHPALADEVRVALTLKSVTGLNIAEVARAFLVPVKTMEQRLLRARKKILTTGITYEVPEGPQLDMRLESVMKTVYLLFNEGYAATSGDRMIRKELCREAIRLATLLQRLFPYRAELMALLALFLLQNSRNEARLSATGDIVLLDEQNRTLWNGKEIQQGLAILDKALHLHQPPGPYQLQASIAALHAQSKSPLDTDWLQISLLYQRLLELAYSEVLHLNYAVAIAMTGEINKALEELRRIEEPLHHYYPFYCARADLHRRIDALEESRNDYQRALQLTDNDAEKRFIRQRLEAIS